MKIGIGADHGGFELKRRLIEHYSEQGVEFVDLGTDSEEPLDYSDIAGPVCDEVLAGMVDVGILICGTGIGMSIAANRRKGIRGAILYSDFAAKMAKEHNNANIMIFGGRTMIFEDVIERFGIFMAAKFEGGRHERRIGKLDR